MLLDRSRPNDQQTFNDYLNDLGKKNGFSDIKSFKKFLINSSKRGITSILLTVWIYLELFLGF